MSSHCCPLNVYSQQGYFIQRMHTKIQVFLQYWCFVTNVILAFLYSHLYYLINFSLNYIYIELQYYKNLNITSGLHKIWYVDYGNIIRFLSLENIKILPKKYNRYYKKNCFLFTKWGPENTLHRPLILI